MNVITGPLVIFALLFAGVFSDEYPPVNEYRLYRSHYPCSVFLWAGSLEKTNPFISKINLLNYDKAFNDKKGLIEDAKQIFNQYKNELGNSGKNFFECTNHLSLEEGSGGLLETYGKCRKYMNQEDIPNLMLPIMLKNIETQHQGRKDFEEATMSKYGCSDPENKEKPECLKWKQFKQCCFKIISADFDEDGPMQIIYQTGRGR
uniref:Uncharacterized protein LOC114345345 n=1 Tax=Diabrotica virgifera virgifera TaxID=50390 RepID=A0A6P7GQW7_DIAVI